MMAVVLATTLSIAVLDTEDDVTEGERALSVARTIRCPQCEGETVAESNVAIAIEIRAEIKSRVSSGQSDNAIREAIAGIYGQDILLTPPGEGAGSLVWIIPVVAVTLALGILGVAFRYRHLDLRAIEKPTPEEIERVEKALRETNEF